MRTTPISVLSCQHPIPAPGTNFDCKQGYPLCLVWQASWTRCVHAVGRSAGLPSNHLVAADLPYPARLLHLVCGRAETKDADGPPLSVTASVCGCDASACMAAKHKPRRSRCSFYCSLEDKIRRSPDPSCSTSIMSACTQRKSGPQTPLAATLRRRHDIMKHTSSM
ncbi:hypothetical protein GY45DRAFT_1044971 [Cubamyces sp. BRFM 1775]|nr:hypothetical protein GY45DRAFT_1044971 [Cubamyces sp. BRFM 1775]